MMKQFFQLSIAFLLLTFSCWGNGYFQAEEVESLGAKRHTLQIKNETHKDEGGPGRDLCLLWKRDVHNSPQVTERLAQGAEDSRESRGIGNGRNFRHFEVEVYRWKNGEKKKIGDFTHSIYAQPLENGHTESTKIFKNYTAETVQLWREYFNPFSEKNEMEPIGSISREEW